ncbi:MAG: hypothetical protein IT532_00480 [Burkholderiales bacterium]|nr:hypothetical protein [Burkholderiales bacterium]
MRTLNLHLARLFWALVAALTVTLALAQALVTEVIPLRYRSAEQLLPVLQALVEKGGTVSAMNSRLIVRTTPENLAGIKEVLTQIDTMPRRLMISVRQDADVQRSARGGRVSGRVETGDEVVISSAGKPTPPGATVQGNGVRARVYSSEAQSGERISQQVQVLEGGQATIRVGQSTPIRTRQWIDTPNGRRLTEMIEYRDIDAGFVVTPRVVGEQVTLDISAAADRLLDSPTGPAQIQRVQTSVTGRLGEWIEVAGIGEEAVQRDSEILARSRDARREARRVLIKVDEIR